MILLILLLLLIYVEIIVSIPLKVKLLKSSSNIPYVPTNNNIEIAKPLKLPIWPVYSGVICQILEWLNLNDIKENIISKIGGRVTPITLANSKDPFLLLVHHAHSFLPFDPIRPLQKLFIQEGFPAHPHSGFDTVTITIESGLKHRDDMGLIQKYSDGDIQWFRTGYGSIHEEMWNIDDSFKKIEIYQLWVNLPSSKKDSTPFVNLIKANDLNFLDIDDNVKVQVVCGDISINNNNNIFQGPGNNMCESTISILQAKFKASSSLTIQTESDVSTTIFVRRGSLLVDEEEITIGNYCKINNNIDSKDFIHKIQAGLNGLECLVLLGKPLNEPCLFQGSFVQAEENKLLRSYKIFNDINMFWDHSLSDDTYIQHINKINLRGRILKEIDKELDYEKYL